MATVNTFTDFTAAQQDIERRRRMAEMLQQQGMQPIEQQTAGGYVVPTSWTQGLAKMLQSIGGGYQQGQLKQEGRDLAERRNQQLAAAISGMPQAQTTIAPGPDDGSGIPSPNQTTVQQPGWKENAAWLGQLGSVGPDAVQLGTSILGMRQKEQENEANREARTMDRIMALDAAAQNAALTREERTARAREAADLRRDLAADADRRSRELAADADKRMREMAAQAAADRAAQAREARADRSANVPITAVTLQDPKNPNATIIVDGRTGRLIGPGPKATDVGKLENKRQFNMQGIGQVIAEAENLLTGAGGKPLPTGSGVGTAIDYAGSLIGMSPSGAKEADSLKSVGAALVSKMPRMEGPQSDKDVALYKESAGRIGDSTIPVERRRAALETVKGLWAKYERLNPGAFEGGGSQAQPVPQAAPARGGVIDFNSLPR